MLSILIPAYNEADTISETVQRLRDVMDTTDITYEIIVINDGSSDKTAEAVTALNVKLVNHPSNGGYGRALKTGIKNASYEWICIIDADGTYPVASIPELMQYIPAFDMVVGARTGKHYWGSFSKRMGRLILLKLITFVIGETIPDANSGMRIFRKQVALQHIKRISSGFSFTTTLTLAMFLDEKFVKYVPIDYFPREGSPSKVKIRVDSLRMLQILAMATVFYNPLKIFLLICMLTVIFGAIFAIISLFVGPSGGWLFFPFSILVSFIIGALGFMTEGIRLQLQNNNMAQNKPSVTETSEFPAEIL